MIHNQQSFNIKLMLFIIAMIIIFVVLWINHLMINDIRNDAHRQVRYLAKSYSNAINSDNEEDIRFVMDILLPSLNFPIIITSKDEISAFMNLGINKKIGSDEYINEAKLMIKSMDEKYEPLDLEWDGIKWGQIHYSDPKFIHRLIWIPYLEIGFAIIFIFLLLLSFQLIWQSEKNMIYVGMARETAHQLGTPVSSIMGWHKLLYDNIKDKKSILESMCKDISRLTEISERFSKIGSKPKLELLNIYSLIHDSVEYMKNRLPKNSKISIYLEGENNIKMNGNSILLKWALENILKNSIDAIGVKQGSIKILIESNNDRTQLNIIDTGKGIYRKNWKNIFLPGFSTKNRGWGLGLSLTKRIIKDIHHGSIKITSSKPGKTVLQVNL